MADEAAQQRAGVGPHRARLASATHDDQQERAKQDGAGEQPGRGQEAVGAMSALGSHAGDQQRLDGDGGHGDAPATDRGDGEAQSDDDPDERAVHRPTATS